MAALQKSKDMTTDDIIEAAYWDFDARTSGYGPYKHIPQSERDAFKSVLRGTIDKLVVESQPYTLEMLDSICDSVNQKPFGYVAIHNYEGPYKYQFHLDQNEVYWDTCKSLVSVYTIPKPVIPFTHKLTLKSVDELATDLYTQHPAYLDSKPLAWDDAPQDIRLEFLNKASSILSSY